LVVVPVRSFVYVVVRTVSYEFPAAFQNPFYYVPALHFYYSPDVQDYLTTVANKGYASFPNEINDIINHIMKGSYLTGMASAKEVEIYNYIVSEMELEIGTRKDSLFGYRWIDENLFDSNWIVALRDSDIAGLAEELEEVGHRGWKQTTRGSGDEWTVCVEYEDGSMERHFGEGANEQFQQLYDYIVKESKAYHARMTEDRKTTTDVSYLVAYEGADPGRIDYASTTVLDWAGIAVFPGNGHSHGLARRWVACWHLPHANAGNLLTEVRKCRKTT